MWNTFLGLEGQTRASTPRSTSSARSTRFTCRAAPFADACAAAIDAARRGARDARRARPSPRPSERDRGRGGSSASPARRDRSGVPGGLRARRRRATAARDYARAAGAFESWLPTTPTGRCPSGHSSFLRAAQARDRGVTPMRALLVDDDRELARLLRDYLGPHGVSLDHVEEGARALERLAPPPSPYDIVLLDVMLPGIDGFEVCRRIRASRDVPIVMLTARGEDTDRVVGLELGADDYLPKPFNPRELLARMRAVLRRAHPAPGRSRQAPAPAGVIEVGDLVVDVPAHKATARRPRAAADVVRVPRPRRPRAPRRRDGDARRARERASSPKGGTLRPERRPLARRPRLAPAPQAGRRRRASRGASAPSAASATCSCGARRVGLLRVSARKVGAARARTAPQMGSCAARGRYGPGSSGGSSAPSCWRC